MESENTQINQEASEAAFTRVKAKLEAVPVEAVVQIVIDLREAALAVQKLKDKVSAEVILEKLKRLPAEHFKPGDLSELEDMTMAGVYIRERLLTAMAQDSDAKLPAPLVSAVLTMRRRLAASVVYQLGEQHKALLEVGDIRSRSGYMDLASDLRRLVRLIRAHREQFVGDRNCRESDLTEGLKLADDIHNTLRYNADETAKWRDLQNRAWAAMNQAYRRIVGAVTLTCANESWIAGDMASIVGLVRAPSRRGRKGKADGTSANTAAPASTTGTPEPEVTAAQPNAA